MSADHSRKRSVSRRRLLGGLSLGVVSLAGCLGRDERSVHDVFRSWEEQRRVGVVADEGEIIRIKVDERRDPPPYSTIVRIYEPGDEFVTETSLPRAVPGSSDPPRVFYQAAVDGRHEFNIEPLTDDVDPTRVWIRITVHEDHPDPSHDPETLAGSV